MSKIICANAVDGLKSIPDNSIDLCVTSPPYYGLRDYGSAEQIGLEKTPDDYILRLTAVFMEVYRVLKPDGTLWVNIADSYAKKTYGNIKPKDMIGIPWMLAFSLRNSGYYLRSDVIWHKTKCLPESVTDRPVRCYEHIFLLSKNRRYYYDYAAIQEPIKPESRARYQRRRSGNTKYSGTKMQQKGIDSERDNFADFNQYYKRKRDIWEVSTTTYKTDEHFAVYPEKLIEPCILACSRIGGTVLDPFFGSGTTGAVAKQLGREYIGIDINEKFCKLAQYRIDKVLDE